MSDSQIHPIKRLTPEQFKDLGYLLDLNRRFLHPQGMALEVIIDEETGDTSFGGVWDYRNDPEGIAFHQDDWILGKIDIERAAQIAEEEKVKRRKREEWLGYVIQPLPLEK